MLFFQTDLFVERCQRRLLEAGISLRQEYDLNRAVDLLSGMGRKDISPMLDPRKTVFTRSNCFWLFAEREGVPMIAGGVRLDDLEREGLDDYLMRAMPVIFGVALRPHTEPYLRDHIGGRLAYFGDLFSNQKTTLGLGKNAKLYMRLFNICAHHLVHSVMRPDAIWCFIRDKDHQRGADKSYGFIGEAPFLHEWEDNPFAAGRPEWIAFNNKQQHALMLSGAEKFLAKQMELT